MNCVHIKSISPKKVLGICRLYNIETLLYLRTPPQNFSRYLFKLKFIEEEKVKQNKKAEELPST